MQTLNLILAYVISFISISVMDAIWHLVLFGNSYKQDFKLVARTQIQTLPGILSQLLVVGSMMYLVLSRNPENHVQAAATGVVGGILAISVYGLVNYSLINNWTLKLTILELVWGPILGSLAGIIIYWLKLKLL